jgi:hypothetical protein
VGAGGGLGGLWQGRAYLMLAPLPRD